MTEDLPLAATTVKGRTRAAMTEDLLGAAEAGRVRVAIGRASDFFGPRRHRNGARRARLRQRRRRQARRLHRQRELLHSYSYVPDIAAGLATLGTDERAVNEVWHLPGPETVTTRAVLDLVSSELGHAVAIRSVPKLVLRGARTLQPADAGAGGDGLRVR